MATSEVTAGVIRPLLSLKAAYVVGGQLCAGVRGRASGGNCQTVGSGDYCELPLERGSRAYI